MAVPQPSDWLRANATEVRRTDREVLQMLRDSKKRVDGILRDIQDSPSRSDAVRRFQLEQSRSRLLAEQAVIFERLGNIVEARRLRAASRAAGMVAETSEALLGAAGQGPLAEALKESFLAVSQRAIDVAMQRMRLSAVPLAERIYNSGVWMNGRLDRLINETLASGLNAREFAKRARDWFSPNTPGGIRYAAMRLARTEINNAFHSMAAEKAANTPWINEVDWILSGSHPKPDECNVLAAGGPYPSDEVPARPHPNCMCVIVPKPIDEDEFVDRFVSGEFDDFLDAELGESVPNTAIQRARVSFADRLQSAKEKEDALLAAPLGLERQLGGRGYHPGLDREMKRGLNRYTGRWYEQINALLRGQSVHSSDVERSQEFIQQIDAAMALSKLEKEVLVYRGIRSAEKLFGDRLNHDLTGMEWREDAYVSTTALEQRTRAFLSGSFSGKVLMRILVPEGTPAIEASPTGAEAELLIGRGQRLRVARDNGVDENGVRRLDIEVVEVQANAAEERRREDGGATGRVVQSASPQGAGSTARPRAAAVGSVAALTPDQAIALNADRAVDRQNASNRIYDDFAYGNMFDRKEQGIDRKPGVREYFANSSRINGALRTGNITPEIQEAIDEIDAAMKLTSNRNPLVVFRGVRKDLLEGKSVGDIVTDQIYWSTAVDPQQAKKFARDNDSVFLQIELPAGTDMIAENATETEVLLPRGTSIQITRIDGDNVFGVLQKANG